MKDKYKTKQQLTSELVELRQQIAQLEKSAAKGKQVEASPRGWNQRLAILNKVAQVTTGSVTSEEMCDRLLEVVRGLMPCDAFLVDTYDAPSAQIRGLRGYDTFDGQLRPVLLEDVAFSIVGKPYEVVISSRRPLLIHRRGKLKKWEQLTPFGDHSRRSASLLFAPLVVGDRVTGIMSVQSYTPDAYTERDMELLESIAHQASPALQATILSEHLRENNKILATLNSVSRVIISSRTPEELSEALVQELRRVMCVDAFFIDAFMPNTKEAYGLGNFDTINGKFQRVAQVDAAFDREASQITRPMIQSKQPVLIHRKPEEMDFASETFVRFGDKSRASASLIYIPLIVGEQVIGVLSVQSYTPDAYSQKDVDLLVAIGRQVAPAVEGVLLYRQLMQNTEALRKSEEEYRLLVENVNDGIVISQNDRFIFFNRRFAEMLGYEPEELSMKDYREVYTPKSIEILMERKARRDRGEDVPARYETLFRKKDGSEIIVEANITIIEYRGKLATFAVIRDITGRKRAQAALREGEERYRALAESISDVFFAMDSELKYVYWNKASEKLTGVSAKEAIGKSILEIFPDDEQTRRAVEVYQEVLRSQQPRTFVNEYKLGGQKFFFEISAYPSKSGLSVFVKDITERKQVEQQLQESEERFRRLVDNTPDIFFSIDLEGNFTFGNKAAERVIGRPVPEMLGKNLRELVVPEYLPLVYENMRRHAAGAKYLKFEVEVFAADGQRVPLLLHTTPIWGKKGDIVGLQGIARDTSEHKRAEKERAALTRLAFRLAETASLAELGRVVQEEVENLLGCDAFFFSHRRADEDVFRQLYATDVVSGKKKIVSMTDQTVEDYKPLEELLQGEPVLINRNEQEYGPSLKRFGNKSRLSASLMFAPVRIQDLTIGIISAQSYTPYRYGTFELALLQRIASMVAPALERAKAEEALRESEERHRRLFEMASDGIFVIDARGRFVDVNEAGCQMFGYSRKELLASDRTILHFPEDTSLPRQIDRLDWHSGAHLPKVRLRHSNGSEVWVEMSITSFETRGQQFQLRIMRDVTERCQAEKALRESEQRYRAVVETAADGISLWDEKGDIVFVNQAELKMFGFTTPAEMLGRSAYYFVVDGDHTTIEKLIKTTVSKGQAITGLIFRARHASGHQLLIETNAARIDIGGKRYILSFHRDITQRPPFH